MAQLTGDITASDARARLPVALRIGILYVAARAITTVFFLIAGQFSGAGSRFGESPGLSDFVLGWDAQWYWYAAVNGYPTELPLTESGQVAENQWAFMPLYAYLSQWIGIPLGSWLAGALVISLVAGYLSCLVLYRMLRLRADSTTAMWAVLFFAAGPLAALFQVGYAESLFLLWLFLALYCLMQRRYAWLYLLIPLMGFTRPGVLAFALLLGLHGIVRWFRRKQDPLPAREVVHIVALGAWASVVGFSWQVIAAVATGDSGAYLATELAWRRNWVSDSEGGFIPFHGFIEAAGFWFTHWRLGPIAGYVALAVAVVAVTAVLLFEPHVVRLGPELRLWSASYLLYLLAVFFPQSSIFRLLLPLSPLWGAVAMPRSRWWRGAVLAVCLAAQWWWIYNMYALGSTIEQIP